MSVHNKLYVKNDILANNGEFIGTIQSSNVTALNEVAIGSTAGQNQGEGSIAIGINTGQNQGEYSVAIGDHAGTNLSNQQVQPNQGSYSISVGRDAGYVQGQYSVAIGFHAGEKQSINSIAIGKQSGTINQESNCVAIGHLAGNDTQGVSSVAIGENAGKNAQGASSVAIGQNAGLSTQGSSSIAIGNQAGSVFQDAGSIALGLNSGQFQQSTNSVAIGKEAGYNQQGVSSVAIGHQAGKNTQGDYSIAIGSQSGKNSQAVNSIILNASGVELNAPNSGLYIKPMRNQTTGNAVFYDTSEGELTYGEVYELVPIPAGTINNITDIDYKSDIEKTTWSDTSLNKYNYYNYYSSPKKPDLRTPYVPLDNSVSVSSEGDLNQAITNQKDNIFITAAFNITSSKVIAFPCKIYGDSSSKPTITGSGVTTSLFNVSSDNVFFQNLTLTNDNTSSNANCIFFGSNNDAKNNCVHDCVFNTNKFAITSSHYQVQIYNNVFQFIGTPDSHSYIFLNRCVGEVLIYNNEIFSNGIISTTFLRINSSNGSTDFNGGNLVLYLNRNSNMDYIERMAIMETVPVNFKLSLIENTIETYTDFFILYGDTMLNGFNEIIAYQNTVFLSGTPGSFKGLIGLDTPGAGGDITYSPVIRAGSNGLPDNLLSDYSPLPNSTNDNPIVCFNNTKFTTSLQVLINPLLVGESLSAFGPSSSVDNAVVFFDGTTGKILKEHANFKFITGSTYGDQLKVPDIVTDGHLSINEKLTTLDTRTQYQTANNNITTLIGELDVAKIKSYQHNCELQFDDTDATLTANGTIVLQASTVRIQGPATTDQMTFTEDQNLISKKYVDDANNIQSIFIQSNASANIGSVTVHSDVSDAGSGAIITTAERTAITDLETKTQNINASAGLTEFTGEVSVDNPHLTYTTTVTSEGPDAGIDAGGRPLQVGMLFTPTKNIKMTKLYLTERMFITYDNLPRVSIFGTSTTDPLLVFDVDETTKFTPDVSTYGYYVKDIQFEFDAGIQYSIQSDLYAGNGNDNNIKTYPAVLGTVFYGFTTFGYVKIGNQQINSTIPFILDCEDNDYDNYFSSNDNNLSKDIYGAGGILDRITVRASNMLYNMKNTTNGFVYPDGIGYKSMFYNPSINEICYSSKEVVNDFYYTVNADANDFHKDNMLIFSWLNTNGNLQVRRAATLPTGFIINSSLIGRTPDYTVGLSLAVNIDVIPVNIPVGARVDAFISPDSSNFQGLMPSYHIICHRTANATTIWIKRIQNNT